MLEVLAVGIEDADLDRLVVQHVDGAVDGGEAGVADEDAPVGKRLACRVPCRRFGFAGGKGGSQCENEQDGRGGGGRCEC